MIDCSSLIIIFMLMLVISFIIWDIFEKVKLKENIKVLPLFFIILLTIIFVLCCNSNLINKTKIIISGYFISCAYNYLMLKNEINKKTIRKMQILCFTL